VVQYLPDFAKIAPQLLAWYRAHKRDLPWRREVSLYRTVVSEFMLQQTQVSTVLPYFARWMERFPDFSTLGAATEADVLKHWEGLGYYRRARNLHRLAQEVSALESLPRTAEEWRKLPGVGDYTAAAVASIALGEQVAVVDGNVVRVLARLCAEDRGLPSGTAAAVFFRPTAQAFIEHATNPGDHNQAMMELGATVCTKANPACTVCPLVEECCAAKLGEPERFPKLQRKKTVKVERDRLLIVREDGAILLHRASSGSQRLAGMLELPEASLLLTPTQLVRNPVRATRRRGISNEQITETLREIPLTNALAKRIAAHPELSFYTPAALAQATLSGPHRKWLSALELPALIR